MQIEKGFFCRCNVVEGIQDFEKVFGKNVSALLVYEVLSNNECLLFSVIIFVSARE